MDATDLAYVSLHDLAARLRAHDLSPVEVTETILTRTERLEPALQAYITLMAESAMADARRAEQEIMTGAYRGPLHGVPVAVKDCFWTMGVRTTMGSRAFADFIPADDAAVVTRLREAGAVITGKTNIPEMCWVTFQGHAFGIPRNPWDTSRFPGISSAGSAIVLAAGMAYGSVGSDTGGSIRHPATFCGITGFKPTLGLISVYGTFALCPNYDHAGPMARSVLDCAHLLDVLAGYDPRDRRSLDAPAPAQGWAGALSASIAPLTIGVPRAYFWGDLLQPDVARSAEAALAVWRDLGWIVRDVDLPPMKPVVDASGIVIPADVAAEYRAVLTDAPELLTEPFRAQAQTVLGFSAVDYIAALRTWQAFGETLQEVFRDVDVLVTPTRSCTAPRQAADGALLDPLPPEGFRTPFNLPGVPALSIPCGFDRNHLPIGIQIIGPRQRDDMVLAAGHAFQQTTDWHVRRPTLT
jgi:aspartyl-tRNA(Asn)/glutamyl-tRNA(Gln) amidotransferase subunit A